MTAIVVNFAECAAKRPPVVKAVPITESEKPFRFPQPKNEREARRRAWCKAQAATAFASGMLDLWRAIELFEGYDGSAGEIGRAFKRACAETARSFDPDRILFAVYRTAIEDQIRTPAYRVDCVKWKEAKLKELTTVPSWMQTISLDEIKCSIAADVAWLNSRKSPRTAKAN